MTINELAKALEEWAPPWVAWERDNVGLQVGDGTRTLRSVLVALDVTPEVVDEAVKKKVNLIVSHHPLLFRLPKTITAGDPQGKMILRLLENGIAVYSAHTNLDFVKGGVSFSLAESLGLKKISFLSPLTERLVKIVVFVPVGHVGQVSRAMSSAGAGIIGEYSDCSFQIRGTGTFRGSSKTNPFLGKKETLETAEEVRLEMIAPRGKLTGIVQAIKQVHPYEEVAYDIYPVLNPDPNYGMGAVGELAAPVTLIKFLKTVRQRLKAGSIRYTGQPGRIIRRVAVCGGSGSELLNEAIAAGADAFVTADVRYHTFHDSTGRIALVDAGHWETEHHILSTLAGMIRKAAAAMRSRLDVTVSRTSTNPIHSL
jgi:dinuclear metal center YbgI/SA1388 family protein